MNKDTAKTVTLPAVPIDPRWRLSKASRDTSIANYALSAGKMSLSTKLCSIISAENRAPHGESLSFWKAVDQVTSLWSRGNQFKLRLLLDNDIAKVLAERWQSDPQSQFPATAIYSPLGLCDNFVQPSYGSNETKTLVTDPVFTAYGASNVTLSIHTWGWAGEYVALINYNTDIYSTDFVNKFKNYMFKYLVAAASPNGFAGEVQKT
ncbi:MAG: hypothetical protein CYPHOPRED_004437 [Cyphobasidiales sp. Tagirdzhanova-0007]|nr:MAG: hypothetical protein CYPHOPRED_004437 [Cyphobasidiales sp. Tagirdzhanova-0007]